MRTADTAAGAAGHAAAIAGPTGARRGGAGRAGKRKAIVAGAPGGSETAGAALGALRAQLARQQVTRKAAGPARAARADGDRAIGGGGRGRRIGIATRPARRSRSRSPIDAVDIVSGIGAVAAVTALAPGCYRTGYHRLCRNIIDTGGGHRGATAEPSTPSRAECRAIPAIGTVRTDYRDHNMLR